MLNSQRSYPNQSWKHHSKSLRVLYIRFLGTGGDYQAFPLSQHCCRHHHNTEAKWGAKLSRSWQCPQHAGAGKAGGLSKLLVLYLAKATAGSPSRESSPEGIRVVLQLCLGKSGLKRMCNPSKFFLTSDGQGHTLQLTAVPMSLDILHNSSPSSFSPTSLDYFSPLPSLNISLFCLWI